MVKATYTREVIRVHRKQLKFDNIRTHFDREELFLLGVSVKKRQWLPLIVRPDTDNDYFWTVDGHRRVLGGDMVGVEEYDAIVVETSLTKTEMRIAQASTAMHQRGLKGWEQYRVAYELLQTNPDWTDKTLSEELGMSDSMPLRVLSPSKCIREVRVALEAGEIGISDCYAISKEQDETKQAEMLAMKRSGASRDDLERHRRQAKRKRNGSVSKTVKVTIPLPSGVAVSFSAGSLSIDELIQATGDVRRAATKARDDDHLNAKEFAIVMQQKAKGKCRPEVASA